MDKIYLFNLLYQQFQNEKCHIDLCQTHNEVFRQVMKPTGRWLGLEALNIFMSYQNVYQLLISTNIHIIRFLRRTIKNAGLFLDII